MSGTCGIADDCDGDGKSYRNVVSWPQLRQWTNLTKILISLNKQKHRMR